MTDAMASLTSALADRYAIERELGAGGMATVYLAHDLKHDRKVAIKVMRPELSAILGGERFTREIKIAAKLHHPHILPLYDSGAADGFLYYVMPYEEGQSLREKLSKEGELPIPEAVRILRDVVEALKHAHKHNVVHRDIKPDNVMLAEDHALVTDFGVAKAVSDATGAIGLTTEGVALGTPAYMAPEQASADPHIDHRADIYAVGVIAYELLTGRTPFVGNTQQELLAAHVTQVPEPVTKYRESVPPALAGLVMKCLEKKAADRWQTAEELLPQLEALATPSGGVTPTGMVPVDRRAKRRWMMYGGAVAVTAVLALIALAVAISDGHGSRLDPNHVVVAVFRNETGEPSFDHVGSRVGHWITQGVQQAGLAVTPWDNALQSSQYVSAEVNAGRVRDPVGALAQETGAGVVITGTVYRVGNDSLEVQANVTDAIRSRMLGTVEPIRGSTASESELINNVQQRVMTFLGMRLEDRLRGWASAVAEPPSFEAYQSFLRGWEHILVREYAEAVPHLQRAVESEPTWALPRMRLRQALFHRNRWDEAESMLRALEALGTKLTPYEQAVVQYMRAQTDGNAEGALEHLRRTASLAPGSPDHYTFASHLNRRNRPSEALEQLQSFDPELGWLRGWVPYWWEITEALNKLGEYEQELEAARRGYALNPDWHAYFLPRLVRPLIDLGRMEEFEAVLDTFEAKLILADYVGVLLGSIRHLRLKGHADMAEDVSRRALRLFEQQAADGAASRDYAVFLFLSGQAEHAKRVLDVLVDEDSENVSIRGQRGVIAATLGNADQAGEDEEWLAAVERPLLMGLNTYWRGAIAGALGDKETGIGLLRRSFAEGRRYYVSILSGFELDPFRDHPEFQELIRPKG